MEMRDLHISPRMLSVLQARARGPVDGVMLGTISSIDALVDNGHLTYQLGVRTKQGSENFALPQEDFKRLLGDLKQDRGFLGHTVGVWYNSGNATLLSPNAPIFLASLKGSGGYSG